MTPIGSASSNIRRGTEFIVHSSCCSRAPLADTHEQLDCRAPPVSSQRRNICRAATAFSDVYALERGEFEFEVARVLENLPRRLSERIANVAFGVEDGLERMNLLGLYEGI